ncbi:RHS repeat-associated core domain-containing protein [Dactylosporangium sp. NPDC000521]|uniref:RHS repeat-associated core domain-containing protein n=1 Tax=Dactylosporangium sp. NPDC000521 TaxID=3363975 RepID=UPI003684E067
MARQRFALPIAVLMLTALAGVVLPATERPRTTPPPTQQWPGVSGAPAKPVQAPALSGGDPWAAPPVSWPAGGTALVDLPAVMGDPTQRDLRSGATRRAPAGRLPVSAAKETADAPAQVRVTLADRPAAQRAGVNGLLLQATAGAGLEARGRMRVWVDPSGILGAYGGDWPNRLRLVSLPGCALRTPELAECQAQTPLPTTRSGAELSTVLDLGAAGASGAAFAVAAAPSGSTGDYSATPFKPVGSWTAGGHSGDFGYSYPIDTPPVPGGLEPSVSLSYSAQSVDGQQVSTNNQTSAIGDGWNYAAGFIQRTYRTCADDPTGTAPKVNDSCWAGQIASISSIAGSGDLVNDPSTPTKWKISNDEGARVELLTGADNGTKNGEYWKITTQNGTQYFFGLNKLPGFASGNPETNSAWTQRVYSPRTSDPCYNAAGFSSSHCDMAWKWNLDYIVDTHHNAVAFYYGKELNRYGANKGTTGVQFVRGGWLDHVDYGLRDPNPYNGRAPARVQFSYGERCIESASACAPGNIASAPTRWPDTPYDLNCDVGATCNNHAVTFWTRLRLTGIATQINNGSGYSTVDSWALTHTFPAPGDGTTPALWLQSIQHTGGTGASAITLPPVTFEPTKLANRADGIDNAPAMNHNRISTISTETGSVIGVGYRTECAAPVSLDPATNTSLCYPVYWTREGFTDPTLDWFHKYVVTEVTEQDPTGGSPPETTRYEYLDGGAWHFDDSELVKAKHRTYGQWRGFGRVRIREGSGTDLKTLSETIYYRGMDGDKLPGGARRSASVTLSSAVPVPGAIVTVPDVEELAGSVRQTVTYTVDGGPADNATVSDYWVSPPTATRARPEVGDLTARIVRTVSSRTTSAITSTSPATWRTTRTDTTFDPATGLPTVVYDYGDVTQPSQATCMVTTYVPANTSVHLVGLTASTERLALPCGGSGANGLTAPAAVNRPADVISSTRSFYDDPAFSATWPPGPAAVGDLSMSQQATDTDGTFGFTTIAKTLYDEYGRPVQVDDALGNRTTTAYTMTNGLTTGVATTNPLNQTVRGTLEPTRGLTVQDTDVNNQTTTQAYDALGRRTGVWVPGRALNLGANEKYAYGVSKTAPLTVSTWNLNDDGSYRLQVEFFDARTRPRQTQTATPVGGRTVTDSFYDSHGWVVKTNAAYYDASSEPTTTMLDMVGKDQQVPSQELTTFDGLGRKVQVTALYKGQVRDVTRNVHGGDRVTSIPPTGGTPTTTVSDARGRTTQLLHYTSMPTVNGPVVSGGNPVQMTYGYDRRGNQDRITDNQGNSWRTVFDIRGRAVQKIDPDAGTSYTRYDEHGNVTSSTDSRGNTTTSVYDKLARKVAEYDGPTTSSPLSARWTYDSVTVPNGIGRLSAQFSYDGTGAVYETRTTGYTVRGNPTGTTVVIPATPANGSLAGTYTFTSQYTATNELLQKTLFPSGGGLPAETVNRTYTATDLPSGIGSALGPYVDSTRYTPFGQVSQTKFGFGTTNVSWATYIYDEHDGKLLNTYIDRSGTGASRINDLTYTYDAFGKIEKIGSARNSGAATETQCFTYDLLGRLTTAWTATDQCAVNLGGGGSDATVGGINPYWTSWTYNTIGDRTKEVQHGLAGVADTTTTYTYPGAGNAQPHTVSAETVTGPGGTRTRTFQYDTDGNTVGRTTPERGTQTLTWDGGGRLDTVKTGTTVNAQYVYDADGDLLLQRNPSANTTTLYLPGQELTLNTSTNTVSGKRYYAATDGTLCVRSATTSTAYSYLFNDKLGTATMTLDYRGQNPSWRAYTPFGAPRGTQPATWPDTHGYLGKPTDATTGYTVLGARHYDPVSGRFASVDPVLNTADPNQLGGYSYAGNDPVNRSDPEGTNSYDLSTPCRIYNCGPANVDRSDTATENATNNAANGWTKPPKTWTPPAGGPPPKKKSSCDSWLCKAKNKAKGAVDASVRWVKSPEGIGTLVGIGLTLGCSALTMGVGALACGALAGAVGAGLTSKLKGNSWGEVALDAGIGGLLGIAGGAVGGAGGTFAAKTVGWMALKGTNRAATQGVAGFFKGAFGGTAIKQGMSQGTAAAVTTTKQFFTDVLSTPTAAKEGTKIVAAGLSRLVTRGAKGPAMGVGAKFYGSVMKANFGNAVAAGGVGGFLPGKREDLTGMTWDPGNTVSGFVGRLFG